MIGDPFITLTYVDSSGKMSFQRFMLGQIVCWMKPFNGKPGSVVVTTEPDDDGRLVAETPDKIDDLIRNLR